MMSVQALTCKNCFFLKSVKSHVAVSREPPTTRAIFSCAGKRELYFALYFSMV
jgi:hypothetical protein